VKLIGSLAAILLSIVLIACGGSPSQTATNPVAGAWSGTLTSSSNQPLGSFTFNMVQTNAKLAGIDLNLANMPGLSQCFGSGVAMNGQVASDGAMNLTMSFTNQVTAQTNSLAMQGTMASGMASASGNFTLTAQAPGCTGQTGSFSLTHISTSMM
jgi:hypothetical protein